MAVNFEGQWLEARYGIFPTAYPGEFFILCRHNEYEIENFKMKMRQMRIIRDIRVQRYSAEEVLEFLKQFP